ncbi:MAG: type I asparaginase [Rikenellaceae bacterium]
MKRILIIYMGGTIGMKENPATGSLAPVDFSEIEREVPELHKLGAELTTLTFSPVIDSSNVSHACWVRLATMIEQNYDLYDGFVVLHGTDTMSYSASALSFMLENLAKPIVFTGSQIPIGVIRTDGKENLISAIEVAAAGIANEVTIFFQDVLMRGNRTTKHNSEYFNAFASHNLPPLAEAGIKIKYNEALLLSTEPNLPLKVHKNLSSDIATIKLHPQIRPEEISAILNIEGLRAVILESYGAGNGPTQGWLLELLGAAIERGVIILNVTQCAAGAVNMSLYDTGKLFEDIGVIGARDITFEAAITKLSYLLGRQDYTPEMVKIALKTEIRAEITI